MALSPQAAIEAAQNLLPGYLKQRRYVEEMNVWIRGDNAGLSVPKTATAELRALARKSQTPYGSLVISNVAQELYVDGFVNGDGTMATDSPAWRAWLGNRVPAQQNSIYRAALGHAESYGLSLPGFVPLTGEPMPKLRTFSAARMRVVYRDDEQEWPLLACSFDEANLGTAKGWQWSLVDEEAVYTGVFELNGDKPLYISTEIHETGVTPVVRWANMLDIDGHASGEIGPLIPILSRIDQDVYDRLVTQRFSSFKVRYATGLAKPENDEEQRVVDLVLRQGDYLANEDPNGKFGTLDSTDLAQFTTAKDADVRDLAAVAQMAPHHLNGQMTNLSAEALAAAESSLFRKVGERQQHFGDSDLQLMRLFAKQSGDDAGASNLTSEPRWRDMQSRSLAQTADALGKLATMLQVPVELLWGKIPGWTEQDVAEARRLASQGDGLAQLTAMLGGQTA